MTRFKILTKFNIFDQIKNDWTKLKNLDQISKILPNLKKLTKFQNFNYLKLWTKFQFQPNFTKLIHLWEPPPSPPQNLTKLIDTGLQLPIFEEGTISFMSVGPNTLLHNQKGTQKS